MRKWECTVCGYIHEGDEPPENCPVCGADKSKFIEITGEKVSPEPPVKARPPLIDETSAYIKIFDVVAGLMAKHHAHPIAVHIPNGVLPLSVLFVLLSVLFHLENFGIAAFYNMLFVFFAMPFVLFSGYVDWKKRLGGNLTRIIITKMICGFVVFVTSGVVVIWQIINPSVAEATSAARWLFLFIHLIMLAAAITAGYFGGKLIFEKN
ncbi:rubredoxin-like domain-containing protein [Thermodesulfobacteriota bacterium]